MGACVKAYSPGGIVRCLAALLLAAALGGCGAIWNDPYPSAEVGQNILYSAFGERPKHLDPAQSYSEEEATIHAQIYESPLQYHYLKRPYTLIPMTTEAVPTPRYVDAAVFLVVANAQPYSKHDWHWRLLVAHRFGHAAAVEAVHMALGLLDDAKIVGELALREVRTGRVPVESVWGRPQSLRDEFRQINAQ